MAHPKTDTTSALENIAARSGLSVKHLRDLKLAGMPLEPLSAALDWLENRTSAPGDDSVADLRRERIRLTRIQGAKAELELSIRRNEFVARAEVREMFSHAGHAIRGSLLAIENVLIPKITGLPVTQAQEIARRELRLVMLKLQDAESDFWQDHPTDGN